jgi:hypothetical protein
VSVALLATLIAPAIVIGYVGASLRALAAPVVESTRTDEQRYFAALPPIDEQIDRSLHRVGLLVASYESGDLDVSKLEPALEQSLAEYRAAEAQLRALDPPTDVSSVQQRYLEALALLERSTTDLQVAYAAGDEGRATVALALSLEGSARLRALTVAN